jgi:uncharacterized protein (DUF362 family)/Pyruvate/2-oxoacid:ferredoxin oxidoreductase delta subunit
VAITKCNSYDRQEVFNAIRKVLGLCGGIGHYIQPGKIVLLKPNILSNSAPETHTTTHPEVVRAIALFAMKTGATVWLGDSPGIGTLKTACQKTGFEELSRELGIPLKEFDERVPVKSPSGFMINIAKPVLDADIIINIPKVKSHMQMFMTLGVKNCFGCVPGSDKAQWHYRAGINEDTFAQFLVQTYLTVKPSLTIADGIIGMEGDGPSGGSPKHLGWIAASQDAVALDRIIMELLSLEPENLKTLMQAKLQGAGETRLEKIRVLGDPLGELRVTYFKTPQRMQSVQFERIPAPFRSYVRDLFTSRPVLRKKSCIRCGRCFSACPARSIIWEINAKPVFIYPTCIRCFCCMEMCESNAIGIRDGFGLKLLQPFRKSLLRRAGI